MNDARHILPRPTPVAIATKVKTKSAITRLVYEISRRKVTLCGLSGSVSCDAWGSKTLIKSTPVG